MTSTLESTAKGLEEYARAAEWRCAQLMSMMQPMFELYKVSTGTMLGHSGEAEAYCGGTRGGVALHLRPLPPAACDSAIGLHP